MAITFRAKRRGAPDWGIAASRGFAERLDGTATLAELARSVRRSGAFGRGSVATGSYSPRHASHWPARRRRNLHGTGRVLPGAGHRGTRTLWRRSGRCDDRDERSALVQLPLGR